jgi:NTP pyrophosphatase (non-canonical NTP hydrolase)
MGNVLTELTRLAVQFRDEREWSQFHTARNLAAAVSVEAAELLELYQWGDPGEEGQTRAAEELADITIYVLTLAHELGIDLEAAIRAKIRSNAERYPIDEVRGSSRKRPRT